MKGQWSKLFVVTVAFVLLAGTCAAPPPPPDGHATDHYTDATHPDSKPAAPVHA